MEANMKIKELWESDFEFRKVAINYFEKFEKEMRDVEQRNDAWGSFSYKGLPYDLNLYIHEDENGNEEYRDCIYAVEINLNGDWQTTSSDNFMVIPETEPLECDSCNHYQYYEVEEPLYCDGEFHGNNGKVFCNNCVGATQ
jgi:hypothetical protein